ncbi:hypothetical protein evm_002318 [Chilo suppressalis]|nr:hypothetical protein evm_002318 [Chilo suppressalis]
MTYFASLFLLIFLVHRSSAFKTISNEEYATFVPFRHLDRFSHCVDAEGGAYCTADFKLVADGPHELYDKMLNYSYSARRHFDYTNPRYGYCITRRCKQFYKGDSESELMEALSSCLNHTLEQKYGLRARIKFGMCFRHGEQKYSVTWLDLFAAAFFFTLVGLAAAGTIYDLNATEKDTKGLQIFLKRGRRPQTPPREARSGLLKEGCGIARVTCGGVLYRRIKWSRVAATGVPYGASPYKTYENFKKYAGGGVVWLWPVLFEALAVSEPDLECNEIVGTVQSEPKMTFFFMSGLFLVYTTLISNDRVPMTWRSLPKTIFLRWLR